jgi:hypothetical protein
MGHNIPRMSDHAILFEREENPLTPDIPYQEFKDLQDYIMLCMDADVPLTDGIISSCKNKLYLNN